MSARILHKAFGLIHRDFLNYFSGEKLWELEGLVAGNWREGFFGLFSGDLQKNVACDEQTYYKNRDNQREDVAFDN